VKVKVFAGDINVGTVFISVSGGISEIITGDMNNVALHSQR